MSDIVIFLVHLFVVPIVCRRLIHATSWHKRSFTRLVAMLVSFLLLVVALSTYITLSSQPPNYYRVLDVDVTASTLEIKRAYKTAALRLHPDKNPSPNAQAEFAHLQAAFEVLEKEDSRRAYDRQGLPEPGRPLITINDYDMTMRMAFQYAAFFAMAYVLCLGCESPNARTYAWVGLFFMGIIEYKLRFSPSWEGFGASWLLSRTPLFEKIMILHAAYPAFVQGCRTLASLLHVDREQALFAELMLQNRALMARFDALERVILQGKHASRENVSECDAASNLTGKAKQRAIERAQTAQQQQQAAQQVQQQPIGLSASGIDLSGINGAGGAGAVVKPPAGFFERYQGVLVFVGIQLAVWLMNR